MTKITKLAVQQCDYPTAGCADSCVLQCPTPPSLRTTVQRTPHLHDADGDSPIRFMMDLNLP